MTTGHSHNNNTGHSDNYIHAHSSAPTQSHSGDIYYNSTTSNFYVCTDSTSAHNNSTGTWIYPDNTTFDIGTGSYKWNEIYIPGGSGTVEIWVPQKCTCCGKDVKEKDDGLSIKMGDKEFWFHRRCFGDKRNSSFIRALIISTDLELLD